MIVKHLSYIKSAGLTSVFGPIQSKEATIVFVDKLALIDVPIANENSP